MSTYMAYSMPYASQGFCDPTTMIRTPIGRESMSSRFNFGAASDIWEAPLDPTKPFDLQRMANIDLSIPELFTPFPTSAAGFHMTPPTPPPIPSAQSLGYDTYPSTFFQPTETPDLFASQPNAYTAYTATSIPVTPNPFLSTSSIPFWERDRIVPVCHRDHAQEPSMAGPRTSRRASSRLSKRHSPYACPSHSVSVSAPPIPQRAPRSRKRRSAPSSPPPPSPSVPTPSPKSKKARTCAPLPDALLPIKILPSSGSLPRCPMPKCGAELPACDAAWRGHFKAMHHDDLCLLPACDGTVSPRCKARCPCPLPGEKACGRGTMAIESVGRHLLNVHVGVAFACPVCGVERTWRESACARHVRLCLRKRGEADSRRGGRR